ncbi:hypothetical protein ASPCAL15116 [Aspergillus calidoustus]|uniref:Saponin hydrolase n=1 Tax=Aspergillus calidoustus TaxID=454130 RepID=A0A0U5GKS1_ASPCI|nr:hypothetical protein ASPCAL15116 [Aspergillus calidoustus]
MGLAYDRLAEHDEDYVKKDEPQVLEIPRKPTDKPPFYRQRKMALLPLAAVALLLSQATSGQSVPKPPRPEPIDVVELPLPPVISSDTVGACTKKANPRRTGCIGQDFVDFQSGDFTLDGDHVVVNLEFIGAPNAPDPASIYTGEQLILVKTNGKTFPNGDPWKCLTCGVPAGNAQSLDPERDYPHVARSGTKALWGHNIIDCGDALLSSDACTPNNTFIYPIFWPVAADGSGAGGVPREMRLHPDDIHMGWSSFTANGGQNTYFGRLEFNPNPSSGDVRAPRYDLVDVNLLMDTTGPASLMVNDQGELEQHPEAIRVGELRGFSGAGDEILYIGPTREANNHDIFAVHVVTGKVRRITSHPEYADPVAFSHDNNWFCVMDTRGSDRQMWMAGMRGIPPLIDGVTVMAAASTRNNYHRRFFQPILIDRYGDRGGYFGQQVNAGSDPNWNGRADPAFSYDGTKIVYWQALVTAPACGGVNPLPCPTSTAQGGRVYRVMLARLKNRKPTQPAPVFDVPDFIPWAIPFPPGSEYPEEYALPPGTYTLRGRVSGTANATFVENPSTGALTTISVEYDNYSDDGEHVINGVESVTSTPNPTNPWMSHVDWTSDLVGTGVVRATKKTGPGGFQLSIDAMTNVFNANGTLTTTIDGVVYRQPANGA